MLKLYTTHCPKCKVLETKLKQKSIEVDICDNVDEMQAKGFKSAPMLELDNGEVLDFAAAVKFVNNL